jgi:hypothetical protein
LAQSVHEITIPAICRKSNVFVAKREFWGAKRYLASTGAKILSSIVDGLGARAARLTPVFRQSTTKLSHCIANDR